jgi:hypothetical protein
VNRQWQKEVPALLKKNGLQGSVGSACDPLVGKTTRAQRRELATRKTELTTAGCDAEPTMDLTAVRERLNAMDLKMKDPAVTMRFLSRIQCPHVLLQRPKGGVRLSSPTRLRFNECDCTKGALRNGRQNQPRQNSSFQVIDLSLESATAESYDNHPVATVNDHVVRVSTMTEAYHWRCHPDSDETFWCWRVVYLLNVMNKR